MTHPPHLAGSYLVLETTNRCSLACVHCTVSEKGHPHHAQNGFLPLATARRLFADLAAVGARFDVLIPFWLGEPLIHPDFEAIWQASVRVAVEHGVFGRIELHTNATHLDEAKRRALLNDAPLTQVIHLTLDADSRDTYRCVKGQDRFESVVRNVEELLRARAATRARWPRVVLQYIVSEQNEAEIPAFRRRWEGLCRELGLPVVAGAQVVPGGDAVALFFRQLDCPTPEEQARQNAVYRAAMAREGLALPAPARSPTSLGGENLAPCGCLWKSPVVGWDGRLTTCTRDNRFENVVGNVLETPFPELWWGPRMAARRREAARGRYPDLPPCTRCFIPRSANYSGISAAEIEAHG